MNELLQKNNTENLKVRFLVTVCAVALLASFNQLSATAAEEEERPTVWVEIGSQLERVSDSQATFNPSFLQQFYDAGFTSPTSNQRSSRYALGGEGKISVEPIGMEWIFSISARYGRSKAQEAIHQQTPTGFIGLFPNIGGSFLAKNLDASSSNSSSHAIVDFDVGRDVGLGLSSLHSSVFSMGVKFAQFGAHQAAQLNGVPDFFRYGVLKLPFQKYPYTHSHHRYFGSIEAQRNFDGVGPSLNWTASRSILGGQEDGGIDVDWGVNVAVLFGRQTVRGEEKTTAARYEFSAFPKLVYTSSFSHKVVSLNRTHSVTVPNIGGFAGVSWRYSRAKIALGYRADFFFGAIDGGIDTRKSYDRNFYGPFATISIGLGG